MLALTTLSMADISGVYTAASAKGTVRRHHHTGATAIVKCVRPRQPTLSLVVRAVF